MKNCASSKVEISSPSTSTVKHAPSELNFCITEMAFERSLPATYRRATAATMKRGMHLVRVTMNLPNTPICTPPAPLNNEGAP